MKKALLFLMISSIVFPTCFACDNLEKKVTEIPFAQKYDGSLGLKEHFYELSYGLLDSFLENGKTFVLLVQGTEDDCVCYLNFLEAITSYMKESDARIYHIKKEDLLETHGLKAQTNGNLIAVFEKGKLKKQILFKDSDESSLEKEAFKKKMDSIVSFSKYCFYLNKRQLDTLLNSDYAGALIYYNRETCGDCSYLNTAFLEDFAYDVASPFYLFDIDEVRNLGTEIYQTFKDDYGLSDKYSEYGYGTGFVPTFQYLLPGEGVPIDQKIKDAAVFANDTLTLVNNEYKITATYWDDSRYHEFLDGVNLAANLLNKMIPQEEVLNGRLRNEAALKYQKPMIEEFLKFYLSWNI